MEYLVTILDYLLGFLIVCGLIYIGELIQKIFDKGKD